MPSSDERKPATVPRTVGQEDVVRFLMSAAAHGGEKVDHIETHISHVFLAGEYAYKMKKAVRLPFVDFSTLGARLTACRDEVEINARTAPEIYLDVIAVNSDADGLGIGAPTSPVEYLVRMRRFAQDCLLDAMASENRLTPTLIREIADQAAKLHLSAARVAAHGASEDFKVTATDLMDRLRRIECRADLRADCSALDGLITTALRKALPEIRSRARHGAVRHVHGDLHLRNICVFDGHVRLFDAIEFEPKYSHIDILYDIAFAVMDLLHRDRNGDAILMLSRYLSATRDYAGIDNLRLFMAVRAGIRALVALLGNATGREAEAQEYLQLACRILKGPSQPRLIGIGGRSGTGKSTLAFNLAPALSSAPDIVVLRADEVRKRMLGAAPEDRLPADAYTPDVTARVYRRLLGDARRVLRNGASAIVDASFLDEDNRSALLSLGHRLDVATTGLFLSAATGTLAQRLDRRTGDASDADATVMQSQKETEDTGPWHRLNTDKSPDAVLRDALAALGHERRPDRQDTQ